MIAASGVRIGWSDLPPRVRAAVEDTLGSPVVEARTQAGGFSPGTADRVVTANGGRAFVKAVGRALNIRSVEMARDELRITAALPDEAPTPRLLGGYDDGEWIAMILEDIEGRHPRTPWEPAELDAAGTALRELAVTLTPSPVPGLPRAADQLGHDFGGWERLAADPPADLDPWALAHLDGLRAAAARGLAAIADGDTLTHCDIRADNLLVRPDGRIVVVDWPWACVGPAWLDTLLLAVNVIVHGGDADQVLTGVDPQHAADVIAGFTGYFLHQCRLPDPPGLPTVRAFQRFQGDALLPWLRGRPAATAVGGAAHRRGPDRPEH
jgi:aminoglycoside phosphotransferase (APT) family kinase protein